MKIMSNSNEVDKLRTLENEIEELKNEIKDFKNKIVILIEQSKTKSLWRKIK